MITAYNLFETERLVVRQYGLQDEELFYQFSSNADVMRYIRPVITRQESDKFLMHNIQIYLSKPNTGRWAVFEKSSGNYAGSFSLLVMDADTAKMHIGYALLPQYWGMGYATELLQYGTGFFFTNHIDDSIYAITEEPNTASQKVLLKCGFSLHSNLKESEKTLLVYVLQRTSPAV